MKHILILSGVIVVLAILARGTIIPGPYTYDEADYAYAASLGWRANALDSPTMSLSDFVKMGLSRGRDAGGKRELSDTIRNSGDVLFYRHWHGPGYSNWLDLVRHLTSDERLSRMSNYVFPIAAAILMYFGTLWLLPGPAGQIAAILSSALYLWSYAVVRSTELGPHQFFAACVAVALLLLAKAATSPERSARRYWYAAVFAAGVAFCLLEVCFALILTILLCGYALRKRLQPDVGFTGRSVGVFVVTVLIVWPGAILKLSFIKAWFFMAYLAVFRRNAWGPDATVAGTWWLRFAQSPAPWVLAAIGAIWFIKTRPRPGVVLPFLIFTLTMSAAISPVKTEMARYALPLWPGLVLFAGLSTGLALATWKPAVRLAATGFILAAMLATSWPSLRADLPRRNTRCESILALIRDRGLATKTLLVPHEDLPMLHYYFQRAHFEQYYDETAIRQQIRNGGLDGVIDRGDPPRWIPASAFR
jgi:hypothetical protein